MFRYLKKSFTHGAAEGSGEGERSDTERSDEAARTATIPTTRS
jgi:hypothetical protein